MAQKKGGLGRGLDALFVDNSVEEISSAGAVKLKLMDIEPNRDQPRRVFDEESLSRLAESVAQHGIIQPLLVRPTADGSYQLVAGERRWRAARLAGLTEVPVVIRELGDEQAAAITLIENLQREDLNPVEEARGFRTLMDKFSLTQEDAALKIGRSRPAVANALRLLSLPESVLALVEGGEISAGHARALLGFDGEEQQLEVSRRIVEKGLTVRDVERLARASKRVPKAPPQAAKRDAFFEEVELTLTEALCRRTKVLTKGKAEAGSLVIDFYDKQDLGRIAAALNNLED